MRLVRVNKELSARLEKEVLPMLPPAAAEIYKSATVVVCNRSRGVAKIKARQAIIPAFVFDEELNFCGKGLIPGGNEFAAYYLAHELAHLKAGISGHNAAFYQAFKELCPPALQHYELKYKPGNASMNGVSLA